MTTHQRLVKVPSAGRIGSKIIKYNKNDWDAMVDLASNYYRDCTGTSKSFQDSEYGDRAIIHLCQQWHRAVTGIDWKFVKESF